MYNNIKSCVTVNNEVSDFFVSYKGVRQGKNMSPLLFTLYVNDLEEYLLSEGCSPLAFNEPRLDIYLKLFVLMYADDTVIMGKVRREYTRL